MVNPHIFMEHEGIIDTIGGMAHMLSQHLEKQNIENPAFIGIHTGGAWVAAELHSRLNIEEELGALDISFYRDDFTKIGVNPKVKPSSIPFNVEDRHIVLIDDVVQSGRTIRAAMNEIFDFGRPASITLVALIERSGRELPVQPDIIGISPPLQNNEQIKLTGPDALTLEIQYK